MRLFALVFRVDVVRPDGTLFGKGFSDALERARAGGEAKERESGGSK